MRALKQFLPLSLCLPMFLGTVMAADYYVDDDAPPGGDGMDWNSAFTHLQDALVAAAISEGSSDVIHVAQGTYRPDQDSANPGGSVDRYESFILFQGLSIRGGYAGLGEPDPDVRDASTYHTILSGDLMQNDGRGDLSDNSLHVLLAEATDLTTLIDGIIVESGNANGFDATSDRGGGLYGHGSSLRLSGCTFRANAGGGPLSPTAGGGGISWTDGELVMRTCRVEANRSYGRGAGIHGIDATLQIRDCLFTDNEATGKQGDGGAFAMTGGEAIISRCVFDENHAWFGGGAICVAGGEALIDNCLVVANSAVAGGGIAIKFAGAASVANCTVVANTSAVGGSGIDAMGGTATRLLNMIVWDNRGSGSTMAGPIDALYSNIQGGWDGESNVDAVPNFAAPDQGDYRLRAGSPCVDAGNNWAIPLDSGDEDDDDIVFELSPYDLDGAPRFSDDPKIGDSGCGFDVTVDLGAYERQFEPRDLIFGDVTGDSSVGVADLLVLLGAWGHDLGGEDCLVDFNVDDDVNQLDLVILLAHWG